MPEVAYVQIPGSVVVVPERRAARMALDHAARVLDLGRRLPLSWYLEAVDAAADVPVLARWTRDEPNLDMAHAGFYQWHGVVFLRAGMGPVLTARTALHEARHAWWHKRAGWPDPWPRSTTRRAREERDAEAWCDRAIADLLGQRLTA